MCVLSGARIEVMIYKKGESFAFRPRKKDGDKERYFFLIKNVRESLCSLRPGPAEDFRGNLDRENPSSEKVLSGVVRSVDRARPPIGTLRMLRSLTCFIIYYFFQKKHTKRILMLKRHQFLVRKWSISGIIIF